VGTWKLSNGVSIVPQSRFNRTDYYLVIECAGAIADIEDKEGETSLHKASLNGHLPVIEYLLTSAGADVHAQDGDGWTPLHNACSKGYLDVVRHLCNHGAGQTIEILNVPTSGIDRKSKGGWTPLSASDSNCVETLTYLTPQ
jgi:ankyrin repeat protein